MLIKGFYVSNLEKSFCLEDFRDGINIIKSDDNNKGKTIVSQGVAFALGADPLFPKGFDVKDYIFIVRLESRGKEILILRKKNTFVVKDGSLKWFENVSEFRGFFSSNIALLPTIYKNGKKHLVFPGLFLEYFFLPQDGRTTYSLFRKGLYNKNDYKEGLFSLKGCPKNSGELNLGALQNEKKGLIEARKEKAGLNKLKIKVIESINEQITECNKERNRILNRIVQNRSLIEELNSLNRSLEAGALVCRDCGSSNIAFKVSDSDILFDVSDDEIRRMVRENILQRIEELQDQKLVIEERLFEQKRLLAEALKDEDVRLETVIAYKDQIIDAASIDEEIRELDKRIAEVQNQIENIGKNEESLETRRDEIRQRLVEDMRGFYKEVLPHDPLEIDDLFTPSDVNYSGSQGTVFLMARLYSIHSLLNVGFPIWIDTFRSDELSSIKEERVLELFKKLDCQVILTCTLKNEESNKYNGSNDYHVIPFDGIREFNLLTDSYNKRFNQVYSSFEIKME